MSVATHTPPPLAVHQPSLIWAAALIVCAGLVAFGNGLFGDFVFDDFQLFRDEQLRHKLWPWGSMPELNRCLGRWTFQWNYAFCGEQVVSYHAVNIGIHLAAGLILFGLVRRGLLLPGIPRRLAERSTWLGLAVALVWMVHPLQTEAVTYVIQRYESLMGLCFLLVLYCTLRGSQSLRPWAWYLAAIVSAWAGAGTKEVMAACPLVLLMFDRAFLAGSFAAALGRRWGLYLAIFPTIAWILWAVQGAFFGVPDPNAGGAGVAAGLSSWEYLRSQPSVILYYLRLTVWPDELILDRGWPISHSPWAIYGLGAAILALLALGFWASWRQPRLGFLGLSFFFILAPSSSLVPLADLAVEHRMYLPLAPLVVLAVLTTTSLCELWFSGSEASWRLLLVGVAAVVVALSVRTIYRNSDYLHAIRLWQQVVAHNPKHARGHRMLARYYFESSRFQEAETEFATSVSLHPHIFHTWIEFGNLFFKQQRYAEARRCYERATQLNPQSWRAWMNIGRCGLIEGDFGLALSSARKAMECEPDNLASRKQAAWILATAPDDRVRNGREALDILRATKPTAKPVDFQYLEVLAAAHAEAAQFEEAIRIAREGLAAARQFDPRRAGTFAACIQRYQSRQPERFHPPQPRALTVASPQPTQGT